MRRKDESNEKLKAKNTKRNTLPVTSKEMERKMTVIQRCRHRHIHIEIDRKKEDMLIKCRKVLFQRPTSTSA